jgi:hypothetical protein
MNLAWSVFAVALAGAVEPVTTQAPEGPGIEVLRIKRDFGKPHFDLAIDAWTAGDRLEQTRLWWVNTSEADRRKPLGPMIERMVKLRYRRSSDRALNVTVHGDDKEFVFSVELDPEGKVHAFVAVDTDDGRTISRCRTDSARLIAHRVLGLPVGLAHIAVTCSEGGASHKGRVRHTQK